MHICWEITLKLQLYIARNPGLERLPGLAGSGLNANTSHKHWYLAPHSTGMNSVGNGRMGQEEQEPAECVAVVGFKQSPKEWTAFQQSGWQEVREVTTGNMQVTKKLLAAPAE